MIFQNRILGFFKTILPQIQKLELRQLRWSVSKKLKNRIRELENLRAKRDNLTVIGNIVFRQIETLQCWNSIQNIVDLVRYDHSRIFGCRLFLDVPGTAAANTSREAPLWPSTMRLMLRPLNPADVMRWCRPCLSRARCRPTIWKDRSDFSVPSSSK